MSLTESLSDWLRKRKRTKLLFVLGPPYVFYLIFFMVPFFLSVAWSLGVFEGVINLENYQRALKPLFLNVLSRTLQFAAFTAGLTIVLGYPVAYFISVRARRYKSFLVALVIVPYFVSFLLRAYSLMTLFAPQGVINGALLSLGVLNEPLYMLYNQPITVLAMIYGYAPFTILPLYASLEKLDVKLLDAGRMLGASPLRVFWHVTLPLTKPGLAAAVLLTFIPASGEYIIPSLFGGTSQYMMGQLIWDFFLGSQNWGFGSALSVVYLGIVMVGVLIYLKYVGEEISI